MKPKTTFTKTDLNEATRNIATRLKEKVDRFVRCGGSDPKATPLNVYIHAALVDLSCDTKPSHPDHLWTARNLAHF